MSDYASFPPGFMPNEEQQALMDQVNALQRDMTRIGGEMRRATTSSAWLLCACRKWYDRSDPGTPPQANCMVHGQVMVGPDGEVL